MQLPHFNEFASTLTQEHMNEMLPNFGHVEFIQMADGVTPQNMNALYSRILELSVEKCITFQLALLNEYHEWLRTQLE